ncbi:MAG TPA: hypothetical protein VHM25_06595 [Polyangiaceae bacterium]|nr:hypothetical protein [Polyangiaceae bacterium]
MSTLCACSSQAPPSDASAPTAGASGSAVGCRSSDGDSYAPGLEKPGSAGQFVFTLVSSTPAPPALDDNVFVLRVSDTDGNPLDGALSVALDMPEHGHPSPKQPEIRFDPESRTFTLEPMRLFMVGLWRITFDFETSADDPRRDTAVFDFCID